MCDTLAGCKLGCEKRYFAGHPTGHYDNRARIARIVDIQMRRSLHFI